MDWKRITVAGKASYTGRDTYNGRYSADVYSFKNDAGKTVWTGSATVKGVAIAVDTILTWATARQARYETERRVNQELARQHNAELESGYAATKMHATVDARCARKTFESYTSQAARADFLSRMRSNDSGSNMIRGAFRAMGGFGFGAQWLAYRDAWNLEWSRHVRRAIIRRTRAVTIERNERTRRLVECMTASKLEDWADQLRTLRRHYHNALCGASLEWLCTVAVIRAEIKRRAPAAGR